MTQLNCKLTGLSLRYFFKIYNTFPLKYRINSPCSTLNKFKSWAFKQVRLIIVIRVNQFFYKVPNILSISVGHDLEFSTSNVSLENTDD